MDMGCREPHAWRLCGGHVRLADVHERRVTADFGKQATANYAVHYMLNLLGQDELIKSRIEQRTSATTGTEIMAWKDALSVPQRGS